MKKLIITLLSIFSVSQLVAQPHIQKFQFKNSWVDSVYNSFTLEQRLGQLFMVAAYSGGEKMNQKWVEEQIRKNNIGGLIFMQGTAEAQAKMTNKYQQISRLPLLIGMDAEWGLGMRLTGIKDLPKQMTIGASKDSALMYDIGTVIAEQCKRLGVHINFAPSIDINNNPKNPVIGFRSFGSDKALVAQLGNAYMKGLQNNGIMASAKHFPGHGDVHIDSHEDLPAIDKNMATLKDVELYPFQQLIKNGVQSVMVAHLNLPQLDNNKVPSTLSYPIITKLLKEEMGFSGLIFTDALNMKAVTKYYADGEIELKAFLAGNDVLLFSQDVNKAISKLAFAYQTGELTEARLASSVKKILGAKYDKRLYDLQPVKVENATADINKAYNEVMQKTALSSISLLKGNPQSFGNFVNSANKVIITYNATAAQIAIYKAQFPQAKFIAVDNKMQLANITASIKSMGTTAQILVSLHGLNRYPGAKNYYGYSENQIKSLQMLSNSNNAQFVIYGVPYMATNFCKAKQVLVAYEDHEAFQFNVLRMLHKDLPVNGTVPVRVCQ